MGVDGKGTGGALVAVHLAVPAGGDAVGADRAIEGGVLEEVGERPGGGAEEE